MHIDLSLAHIFKCFFMSLFIILSWLLCALLHVFLLKCFHKEHYWVYDGSFYMVYLLGPIGFIMSIFEFITEKRESYERRKK